MEKQILLDRISNGHSIRKIAKEFGKGYQTIRFWIKKYNLKTEYSKNNEDLFHCRRCKDKLDQCNTYKYKQKRILCKKCIAEQKYHEFKKFKEECVKYKGGKCEECGYHKSLSALEFHHKDPSEKDFEISKNKSSKFPNERVIIELEKCELLCSNCHIEKHEKIFLEKLHR